MFANNTGTLDRIYDTLGAEAASGLRGLGNCSLPLTHRAPVSIITSARAGNRIPALTVKMHPVKPETLATENPANGPTVDIWGKLRVRGHVQFDQGLAGGGLTFEDLLELFPVGFQMQWHDETDIPTGWAIMDGVANATGSGINRGGRVPYGYIAGDPTFGTLGGAVAVALTWSGDPIAGGGLLTTSETGAHSHTISTSEVTTKIASASLPHGGLGSGFVQTEFCIFAIDDTGDEFDGVDNNANYVNDESVPAKLTTQGHRHDLSVEAVSDAFSSHPATAVTCSSALNTSSVSDHDHTIPSVDIAGELTVNTPSAIRPAGIVELWIEKLP